MVLVNDNLCTLLATTVYTKKSYGTNKASCILRILNLVVTAAILWVGHNNIIISFGK